MTKKITSQAHLSEDIKDLVRSHELLSQIAQKAADALNEHKDVYSADMMIKRVGEHDKAAWMLKSILQK